MESHADRGGGGESGRGENGGGGWFCVCVRHTQILSMDGNDSEPGSSVQDDIVYGTCLCFPECILRVN